MWGEEVDHIGVNHPTPFSKTLMSCISQSVAGSHCNSKKHAQEMLTWIYREQTSEHYLSGWPKMSISQLPYRTQSTSFKLKEQ